MYVVVRTNEVSMALAVTTFLRSGLTLPVGTLDDTDEVHQRISVQRIMDGVRAGPDPVGADIRRMD